MQELEKELSHRIKYVVSLSKEIPWYVRKYKELGIDPDEIKNPKDLLKAYEKGLYTTSADLPELVSPYKVFRQWFLTSGTSSRRRGELPKGKPIAMTIDDRERNKRACRIGYEKFIKRGDKILNCFPYSPGISGEASVHGLEDFEINVLHVGPQVLSDTEQFLRWYSVFKPNVVFGLMASIYQLPLKLKDQNVEPSSLNLEKFMIGGQPSSLEERKIVSKDFGNALVYDWYASTESLGPMACEIEPFSDEYEVVLPEVLLSVVRGNEILSEGEKGNTLITNLYKVGEKPHMVLINYLFSDDVVRCDEVEEERYATLISEIENAFINLGGSKLTLREIKSVRAKLEEGPYKGVLSREPPFVRNYRDEKTRKDIAIIRIESTKTLEDSEKNKIAELIRKKIYEINYPVLEQVEKVKSSELYIEITNPRELYKGYEKYLTPGKPLELLKI